MAKEKNSSKIPKKEEEYRFEEEYTEPEPSGKPKRNWSALLLNRRLIAVVAVIIAVFVVYQFIKTPTVSREITQAEQPTIQPTMQPTTTTTTTTQLAPTVTTPPQVNPIVVQPQPPEQPSVGTIGTTNVVVGGQTQQSAADIRDLRSGMQQIQGQISQVTNQLSTLTNSINTLTTTNLCKVTPPPAKAAVITKPVPIKFVVPRRIYFVRAVVPGRAWLHATDGHLTTVKVGDLLRGYGRIQLINPSEGKVYTSSGDIIRYGANDS